MNNRYTTCTILMLLMVLVGMLILVSTQQKRSSEVVMETVESYHYDADTMNGLNIYTYGKTIDGKMVPFQGGPGWLIQKEAGCAICHGDDGRGREDVEGVEISPPNIAKLTREGGSLSYEEFAEIIRTGVGKNGKTLSMDMPRYSMPDNFIHDLYEYVLGF